MGHLSCATAPFRSVLLLTAAVFCLRSPIAITQASPQPAPQCRPGTLVRISGASEASGIAVSHRVTGRLWTHNDSQPVLIQLDTQGTVTGRVRLSGIKIDDWEAVAVGPCPEGSCIYVGDIGDNSARRKRITIYRLPEPAAAETEVTVTEAFHGTYPDGPHDAEAMLVTTDGRLFIVTKGETGAIGLYRFPKELRSGGTHALEALSKPPAGVKASPRDRITDGGVSGDGAWVVLRTNRYLAFHRASELLTGNWRETDRIDLKGIGEPQGEGVAMAGDAVYLAGEGGGKSQPGTFARLMCADKK